jgi:hypothetical protein
MAEDCGVSGHMEPGIHLLPQRAIVEEVLGTSLLPAGVPYEVRDGTPRDIRSTVYDLIMTGVVHVVDREVGRPDDDGRYLTTAEHAGIQEHVGDVVTHARRQIIIANNIAESVDHPMAAPPGADASNTPRAMLQSGIGARLYDFAQRPNPTRLPGRTALGPLAALQSGLLVVSATATGKTIPVAEFAQRAGVGKPFSETDPKMNRMLLVVPSVDLMREYLRPDSALRLWLPDVEITEIYHGAKNVGGGVQIVVDESLPTAIRSGLVDLADYPIRVYDEGHHARAPRVMGVLGQLAAGRLVLCTATAGQMKRYFVDFTASTPRSAAEDGITRPVELVTLHYRPEEGAERDLAAEKLVARVARRMIAEGLRVGIYCRPLRGRPGAQQAKDVVELINAEPIDVRDGGEVAEGDYARVVADVVGDKENDRTEADYRAGRVRCFAAINKWGEGVNLPMDVQFILGPRRDQDRWDQIAGRLPRPLIGDPDLVKRPGLHIEVQPAEVPEGPPLASFWRTYGLEDSDAIEQGMYIGPAGEDEIIDSLVGYEELLSEGEMAGFPEVTSNPAARPPDGHVAPRYMRRGRRRSGVASALEILADEGLEEYLAPPVPVRALTLAPSEWKRYEKPAEGSKPLAELAGKYNVPEVWLRRQLDLMSAKREDITYVGVRTAVEVEETRGWEYVRWYGPSTEAYLDANPPAELAETEQMTANGIAEMTGASFTYIKIIIARLESADGAPLPSELRLGANAHRELTHYGMPEIRRIVAEVEKIPFAKPDEVALADLARETSLTHAYGFVSAKKHEVVTFERRRPPESGLRSYGQHVSEADAARIREAFFNPRRATEEDISIVEVARRAQVTVSSVTRRIEKMPDEVRPYVYDCKVGDMKPAAHMDRAAGLELAEQMRPSKLTPDRVTLGLLGQYFDVTHKTILKRVRELTERQVLTAEEGKMGLVNLGGSGSATATWTWRVMQALEHEGALPVRDGVERVDYDLTARGPYDHSWQYSQVVQKQYVKPDKLLHLPSRSQLRRIGTRRTDALDVVELSAYAASRQIREQDILTAVADEAVNTELYYHELEALGQPVYMIDGADIPRFDRHFGVEPPTPAVSPADPTLPAAPQAPVQALPVAAAGTADTAPVEERREEPRAEVVNAESGDLEGTADAQGAADAQSDGDRMALTELAALTGRSLPAVRGVVRQLGFEGRIEHGTLPRQNALSIAAVLAGGKQARATAATTATAAGTATDAKRLDTTQGTPSEAKVPQPTPLQSAEEADYSDWTAAAVAMTRLRCTGAALSYLVASDSEHKRGVHRTEDGETLLSPALIGRIVATSRRIRPSDDGWMRHEVLARNMGVPPQGLASALRERGVGIGAGDARVVRLSGSAAYDFDVSYSPRVWRRAVAGRS